MKLAKLNNKPEIFHTIQGEGKSLGKPSIFVRTSLCNLHCIWCDTDYTWNWENTPFETTTNTKYKREDYIIELTAAEVAQEIRQYGCYRVVLTGGEPMMHQKDLVALMKILKAENPGYYFEVETNCTLLPNQDFDKLVDQYNLSPKLANSNNEEKIRLKPAVLSFFSNHKKSNFKFVIANEDDLEEVLNIINEYNINAEKVFLMPEGTEADALHQKQQWLVENCKQYGFNYTDRLHIHIYGSKRGV